MPNDQGSRPIPQGKIFERLRWMLARNTTNVLLEHSSIRLITILSCSIVVWCVVYALAAEGFVYLSQNKIALTGSIVATVFDLLFLSLTILLMFSSGIILYSSLFSSAEGTFLLSLPARDSEVFAYKFQGSIAFSSWGFLLLGSPVLIAFGRASTVPWHYYFLSLFYILGFVLIPGSIGALCCLLFVNYLPRQRKQIAWIALVLALCGLVYASWTLYQMQPDINNEPAYTNFIQRVLGQFSLAQGPLAPNHWMSEGMLASARGDLDKANKYLMLVLANGYFLYILTTWLAGRLYRRGFNRVHTGGSLRRRYGGSWLDQGLDTLVGFLDPQTRLLIIKDFRTFRRDPAQWAQVLIFTGLMMLYFMNMRKFYQEDMSRVYQNGISSINLLATSLLLCSYTGRFIYPMLSLEGRKFWILGLLPLKRERLLWGKFAFSATWALLISEFLIVFSDCMLGMPAFLILLHIVTVAMLSFGLSGLSVGLGACMPNFRETDPSKIAVGFGGTLNLVGGLLYLIVVVGLISGPWHVRAAMSNGNVTEFWSPAGIWMTLGAMVGTGIGIAASVVPLRIGAQTLREMEF